jgi:hypothetical protein
MINVHDINHHMNLVIQFFLKLGIVGRLKTCCKACMHIFFTSQKELKTLLN